MFKQLNVKVLFTEILLLFVIQSTVAQTVRQTTYVKFDQLINQLENKYHIHFYYKSEWFNMLNFNSVILSLPFDEALGKLESESGFSVYTIDSTLYTFVPIVPEPEPQAKAKRSDEIVIGNPLEYGKYSKVAIHGIIVEGISKNPMPGASLFIDKLKLGAMADTKGNFRIVVPVGEYSMRVTFMGYDESTYNIKLVGDGELNPELYEKSIKLNEVVISAKRPDLNVSGTQMSFVSLDSRSISELPMSIGGSDIIKSITLLPGVQTVGEFGTGFNVRGGSADQNLILLEDVPLFNSSHMFGLMSVVNSDGVSNMTLLKAGIPAKYGERASSVLDIRFGAEDPKTRTVKGGIGLIDSRLYIETPVINSKFNLIVSARSSYSNWLLHKIPDVDLMNSSAQFYDVNTLLSYTPTSSDKLSLFAYISNDQFGFTKSTTYRYSNLLASVTWKHTFSNILYFNLVAGLSNYRFAVEESDSAKSREAYKINSSLIYKNIKWNLSWFPLENHAVDFGINSAFYTINPGNLSPLNVESDIEKSQMPNEKAVESAAYLSDDISLTPKLTLDIGLRYSIYSYLGPGKVYSFNPDLPKNRGSIIDSIFYPNNKIVCTYSGLEPRLSMRYSTSASSSLKLSYNRIHQYVNLISNTSVMNPSDVWKLSSPNLKPLSCDHVAIGFFQNFKNNSIESSIEVYYKRLKNAIDYKNGTRILLNPYIETDLLNVSGNNYGVELYVKKNTGRLTGWLSYTYSRSLQKTNGVFDEEKINNNMTFPSNFDRPNNLAVNFNYHISRRWRFGGTFTYSTGRPVTLPEYKFSYQDYSLIYYSDRNKYRLPDYHRLDVSITYDKSLKLKKGWKGSWTLSVINLYGRKNAYSVFYKKEDHMAGTLERQYDTYMLYIIGIPLPMLTYNFSF